jgi:4-hydroxybutyrate dehydrogenase
MATITYLTRIEFDFEATKLLPDLVRDLNIKKPLVVTDSYLAESDLLKKLIKLIQDASPVLFTDTPQNPTEKAVESAVKIYQENKCDGIIAVGGGSSIDLAKGAALLATHNGPLEQYAVILGGLNKITPKVAPIIAIPTTAGTGSEVGRGALITLNDGRKLGFISPHLIPKIALCDPLLTFTLPQRLTAATGMDALTHCIETFLSPRINPPADAIALDGAKRAAKWIEAAFKDGKNQEARWNMMMASLQGGLTFQKGLGAVHSMSHPLGGLKNITLHHGTLNALILPAVLRFNREHCKEKLQILEQHMGISPQIRLEDFIASLNLRLDLPISLSSLGVTRDMLPQMIEGAFNDHSTATNPRPLNKEDFVYLFDQVF